MLTVKKLYIYIYIYISTCRPAILTELIIDVEVGILIY